MGKIISSLKYTKKIISYTHPCLLLFLTGKESIWTCDAARRADRRTLKSDDWGTASCEASDGGSWGLRPFLMNRKTCQSTGVWDYCRWPRRGSFFTLKVAKHIPWFPIGRNESRSARVSYHFVYIPAASSALVPCEPSLLQSSLSIRCSQLTGSPQG